jgi:hypothetical protein
MIEMGHNLGHTIVAEGIETQAQLELIKRLKCDTAQGYLFSRPVVAEEIPKLVLNGIHDHALFTNNPLPYQNADNLTLAIDSVFALFCSFSISVGCSK